MKKLILKDGSLCIIRKVKLSEKEKIRELFSQASPESRYYRFFGATNKIDDKVLDAMIRNDTFNVSLICIVKDKIVGIANYSATPDLQSAEVSFLIQDDFQGKGIGTLFLEELAKYAWLRGIRDLEAIVLADNYNMIGVFKNSGFELVHEKPDPSIVHLKLPLVKFDKVTSLHLLREKLATQASLKSAFYPNKIVFIGNDCLLWHNIFQTRSDAQILSPNSNIVKEVQEAKPDLLIIDIVDCKNLTYFLAVDSIKVLIITTKLNEPIKSQVIALIKKQGIRLIGPYSTGLFYNMPNAKLNISKIRLPKSSHLAIATHSNLLGINLVYSFNYIGIGVGCFVSVGDKSDVSGNDLLYLWQDDEHVEIIVLYLDSFGDPTVFSMLARKISKQKPIFAVKAGKTPLSLSISRHESLFFSNTDFTVDGLFKQTGIIRAETLEELLDDVLLMHTFDNLSTLSYVTLISNSKGANLMAIDTFEANNLLLESIVYIEEEDSIVDSYKKNLLEILTSSKSDYIVIIFAPTQEVSSEYLDEFLSEILLSVNSVEHNKNIIVNLLSFLHYKDRVFSKENLKKKIAVYPFVERSLRALGKLVWYANYKQKTQFYARDLENFNIKEARNYIRNLLSNAKTYQLTQKEAGLLFNTIGVKKTSFEVEGVYNISIGLAYDKLFGPVIGISYYLYEINIAYKSPIVRILPLTLSDIEEVIVLIDNKNKLDVKTKQNLNDFLIRLSEAFLQIPEIKQLDLPNLIVANDGLYFTKAIIKANKDDTQPKSFTINF
ncbi:MAG: GNAT family N-acetyltransferase [Desulfurella sp.]|uniref:GNAT family N-acetyltransferase n=1 Tax=Desulfurella sp. TaxID=1962857 RepID=UPI003CA73248